VQSGASVLLTERLGVYGPLCQGGMVFLV
jgi:hypothetical protein